MKKKLRKRRKRKIVLIRKRSIMSLLIVLLVILFGSMVINLIDSIGEISYRKKYDKNLTASQLKTMEEELDIQHIYYKWNSNLNYGNRPRKIIVHHAAIKVATPEKINEIHTDNGWAGIGYHFYIRKDGTIYRGRNENVIGSHAKSNNNNTLGICLEGNFDEEGLGQTQMKALEELATYLSLKYDINDILRHSDVVDTACPGGNFPFETVKEDIINNIKNK